MDTEGKEQQQNRDEGKMIELQPSLVARFCKERLKDHLISSDFRKEFSKALSLFIFYLQAFQTKKNYTHDDLIATLQKRGMQTLAERLINNHTIGNRKETHEKSQQPPPEPAE